MSFHDHIRFFVASSFAAAILALGGTAQAVIITDDFNTNHDYSGGSVAGTIWDGVLNPSTGTGILQDANITNTGRLSVYATNGAWENSGTGFLLYKNVTGDFTAVVNVTDSSNPNFHDRGLMSRDATTTENYVSARYFTPSSGGGGNSLRDTDNSSSANIGAGTSPPDRWLKLERVGSLFTTTFASDQAFTTDLSSAFVTRNDLPATLQVGIWQSTFVGNLGQAQFDDFSLTIVPEPASAAMLAFGMIAGLRLFRRKR